MYEYISAVIQHAVYESDTDGSTYAHVTLVWPIEAQGRTYKECAAALRLRVQQAVIDAQHTGAALPSINGVQPPALN